MGCGCKKRKAQSTTTQKPTPQNVKESVKVVINKYNKVKK